MNPGAWELTAQLLAHLGDLVAMGNWQRGGDKNAKKPKPIPRPGLRNDADAQVFGSGEMSIEEADLWLSGVGMVITPSKAEVIAAD